MPEIVSCPSCGKQLRVPDSLLGKNVKCPQCATTFIGGASAGPEPVEPAPAWDRGEDAGPRRPRYQDDDDEYDRPRRGWRGDYEPHRGGAILTLGILSLFICGPILGPIAWIMGNTDMDKIRRGIMDPSGEGSTQAGRICGIIATILSIVVIIFYVILLAAMAGGGAFR